VKEGINLEAITMMNMTIKMLTTDVRWDLIDFTINDATGENPDVKTGRSWRHTSGRLERATKFSGT
jgi:hypothetical protein